MRTTLTTTIPTLLKTLWVPVGPSGSRPTTGSGSSGWVRVPPLPTGGPTQNHPSKTTPKSTKNPDPLDPPTDPPETTKEITAPTAWSSVATADLMAAR